MTVNAVSMKLLSNFYSYIGQTRYPAMQVRAATGASMFNPADNINVLLPNIGKDRWQVFTGHHAEAGSRSSSGDTTMRIYKDGGYQAHKTTHDNYYSGWGWGIDYLWGAAGSKLGPNTQHYTSGGPMCEASKPYCFWFDVIEHGAPRLGYTASKVSAYLANSSTTYIQTADSNAVWTNVIDTCDSHTALNGHFYAPEGCTWALVHWNMMRDIDSTGDMTSTLIKNGSEVVRRLGNSRQNRDMAGCFGLIPMNGAGDRLKLSVYSAVACNLLGYHSQITIEWI